jgi:hypothetical protein
METIRLEYSKPLIKKAIQFYWWRHVGPVFIVVTIAMIIFFIYRILNGDRTWLVGLVGAVIFIAVSVMIASYFVHLTRSLAKLRVMGKPEAVLELESSKFRISSGAGSSEMEWSLINQAWCFDGVWLLFFSGGEFMTLPTNNISKENKEFILSKLEQVGAKIV